MNENEIIGCMGRIEALCKQVALDCDQARQQGRMSTLAEARHMDELSVELLQGVRELPENACRMIKNTDQQHWAESVMESVRETLGRIVRQEKPAHSETHSVPRAASRRMEAYTNG